MANTKSTKATTNNATVKEIKAMANAKVSTKETKAKATVSKQTKTKETKVKEETTMAKNTTTMELSAEELQIINDMRAGKTVKTSNPKAKVKDFNRAKYELIAKKLGVYGFHGVYKFARPVVYKAMEQVKTGAEDKVDYKEYIDELVQIAKKEKIQWFLDKQNAPKKRGRKANA